jgi:putative transposase
MTAYKKNLLKAREARQREQKISKQTNKLRRRFGIRTGGRHKVDPVVKKENLSYLDQQARLGAEAKVQELLEAEVTDHLQRGRYQHEADAEPQGYRNGHGPKRTMATRAGPVAIQRPKLRDLKQPFESRIVPPRQRQTSGVDDYLPSLYLAGLSLGDFATFLHELLGEGACLSAAYVCRLKTKWEAEYREWCQRSLQKGYAYIWADGIHLRIGSCCDRLAILVVIGVNENGEKELLAVEPGYRESTSNWRDVFRRLRARGVETIRLIIGDGCQALWAAAEECYWEAAQQLCWCHKMRNVLDKLPDRLADEAKAALRAIYYAPTRAAATEGIVRFTEEYRSYGPAVACLVRDQQRLLTYYDFPKAHWRSIKTTNPIESMFDPVRKRLNKAKRIRSIYAGLSMTYELLKLRQTRMHRIVAPEMTANVIAGDRYQDGIAVDRRRRAS